jgi:hypothetical protein
MNSDFPLAVVRQACLAGLLLRNHPDRTEGARHLRPFASIKVKSYKDLIPIFTRFLPIRQGPGISTAQTCTFMGTVDSYTVACEQCRIMLRIVHD